jgi:Na+-driven multidrug efflux pump
MQRIALFSFVFTLLLNSSPSTVNAYIGPGLGLGVVGAVLGVITSIFLAIFALFWYPIKRWRKRGKESRTKAER